MGLWITIATSALNIITAQAGTALGAANRPQERALESGDVVFTDSEASVLKLDGKTGQCSLLASGAPLVRPCGIAVDADRNVIVSDTGSLAVFSIHPQTAAISLICAEKSLGIPFGIASSKRGGIWVANGQAVLWVDPAKAVPIKVSSGKLLRAPLGVAESPCGNLLVADAAGSVVQLDPQSGDEVLVPGLDNIVSPTAIAIRGDSTLYVSDTRSRSVVELNLHNGASKWFTGDGQFVSPFGLTHVGQHHLVVADPDAMELASALFLVDLNAGTTTPLLTGTGNQVNFRCVALVPEAPKNDTLRK